MAHRADSGEHRFKIVSTWCIWLDQDDAGVQCSPHESRIHDSWEAVLQELDSVQWWTLFPIIAAGAFKERIWTAFSERVRRFQAPVRLHVIAKWGDLCGHFQAPQPHDAGLQ